MSTSCVLSCFSNRKKVEASHAMLAVVRKSAAVRKKINYENNTLLAHLRIFVVNFINVASHTQQKRLDK